MEDDKERLWRQSTLRDAILGITTAGLFHELNNLLTPVLGFTAYVPTQVKPEDPIYPLALDAQRSTREALDLFKALRDLKRSSPGSSPLAGVAETLHAMRPLLKALLGPQTTLDLQLAQGLAPQNAMNLRLAALTLCAIGRASIQGPGDARFQAGQEKDKAYLELTVGPADPADEGLLGQETQCWAMVQGELTSNLKDDELSLRLTWRQTSI